MKKSLVTGSLLGALITIAIGYFLVTSRALKSSPQGADALAVQEPSEPIDLPTVYINPDFETAFPGHEDLLTHQAKLQPSISLDKWDKFVGEIGLKSTASVSEDCAASDPATSISIPPSFSEAIESGKMNVFILDRRIPRCFVQRSKVAVLVEDPVGNPKLYEILGEARIERILDLQINQISDPMLKELGISRSDLSFLKNPFRTSIEAIDIVTILVVAFQNQKPILEVSVIPPFVPGAIAIKPNSIHRHFQTPRITLKAKFVDARDRKNISSGPTYPGSIYVPFVSSNPIQLKFQLDLPVSVVAGATVDTRALPQDINTPLVVFGNDSSDAAPLWVIRQLRLLNYYNLYYVEGGMKALNELKTPVRL